MAQLHVVRHAQASFMRDDYDQLCPRGLQQADALAAHLVSQHQDRKPEIPWRLVSGPARRHQETAAPIGAAMADAGLLPAGRSPHEDARWDEFDLRGLLHAGAASGDPQLLPLLAAMGAAPDLAARGRALHRCTEVVVSRWMDGQLEADGLESWAEFEARVSAALEAARPASGQAAAVVTSVGPICVVLMRALDVDGPTAFRTASRVRNSAVMTLLSGPPGLTLERFNDTTHLTDPDDLTLR